MYVGMYGGVATVQTKEKKFYFATTTISITTDNIIIPFLLTSSTVYSTWIYAVKNILTWVNQSALGTVLHCARVLCNFLLTATMKTE